MNSDLLSSDSRQLEQTRARAHPRCVVCSPANPMGLGLEFALQADGSVQSDFAGSELFVGYPSRLHGGVIAALLDGAMTNCLFALGRQAVTGELTVRYRHPVAAKDRMTVRAWLTDSHGTFHLLRAELCQGNALKVTALGKFVECHE